MLQEILQSRCLPDFRSKEEMVDVLLREEYGYLPPKPDSMTWQLTETHIRNFCAGKATCTKVDLTCTFGDKSFTFPFFCSIPVKEGKYPFVVFANFRGENVYDQFLPIEEVIDNDVAVLSFGYTDITSDDNDFTTGLAGVLYPDGRRGPSDASKISMWAWTAQRILDYAEAELSHVLDLDRAAVAGHSRLGKTALLAGATDTRFRFTYSNDSGCSGAAISRGKQGETVDYIVNKFPQWFCKNYEHHRNKEDQMPFDQHWLLACIAPRPVLVGSATADLWADPDSEMLACVAASPAYEKMGVPGFISEDRLPQPNDIFFEGTIGYHLRVGAHCMGREDWQRLIKFMKQHS